MTSKNEAPTNGGQGGASLARRRAALTRLGAAVVDAVASMAPEPTPEPASKWMRASASPLPEKTVRKLVADGTIAAARPGKFLLLDREQHDGWIGKHALERAANDDTGELEDESGDDLLDRLGLEPAPRPRRRAS